MWSKRREADGWKYKTVYPLSRPLRLYRLDSSTLVDAELAAYAAGIGFWEDTLDTLERELFVTTALDYGIPPGATVWRSNPSLPLSDRREMPLYRGRDYSGGLYPGGIERAVAAAGVRSIQENRPDGLLYINCIELLNSFAGQEAVKRAAQEFLPAHLDALFDFRICPECHRHPRPGF